MQNKYSVKEGKLYKNGELADIVIGDLEIINFIKNENSRLADLKENGFILDLSVETYYKVETSFKCLCGQNVYMESEDEDEDDAIKDLVGKKRCRSCNVEYDISFNEDEDLIAIIKK